MNCFYKVELNLNSFFKMVWSLSKISLLNILCDSLSTNHKYLVETGVCVRDYTLCTYTTKIEYRSRCDRFVRLN